MSSKIRFAKMTLKKVCLTVGVVSLFSFTMMQCDSSTNPAPAPATAMTLVSPIGGENYKFDSLITVKWIGNPDSIGTPALRSFTMQFSLDSGKNWIKMKDSVSLANTDGSTYQIAWKGLDTSQVNPVTFANLTKTDFLNKGILAEVISYPPKQITRKSGYFFFHN